MENIKYGRRREGRWTPIRAKAQDTRANPNSSETHLVRKRWDIGLLRALNPRIMMMMMSCKWAIFAWKIYFLNCLKISTFFENFPGKFEIFQKFSWKKLKFFVKLSE